MRYRCRMSRIAVVAAVAAVVAAVAACGGPPPIAALQASQFEEAGRRATAAIRLDPQNAQAAAVRAIAAYQAAGQALVDGLVQVIERADALHAFDHEDGRRQWRGFLASLDAIDRDLATAAADPGFALELCLACWEHDWNHNGRIDDRDRKLFEIEYDGKGGELADGDPRRRPTFRFDVGDLDWARAMIAFQRAAVEVILAYSWADLDKLFGRGDPHIVLRVIEPDRVRRARAAILAGLDHADRCRAEYLAETDDDREWVPNPRQRSHPMPLDVDARLYDTWAQVTGDVHRLLASEDGLSLREVAQLVDRRIGFLVPDAYVDLGRMLDQPSDIVLDLHDDARPAAHFERILRDLLGHGYRTEMRASALPSRLRRMRDELDHGDDTLERKLRYLLWLN
jgi:hypothetical protein